MIIDALGLMEHIVITVDTDNAFEVAAYRAEDPSVDEMLKRVMLGGTDVNGMGMTDNGRASPWGIINRLTELGYDVKADGYKEPEEEEQDLPMESGVLY